MESSEKSPSFSSLLLFYFRQFTPTVWPLHSSDCDSRHRQL